MQVHCTTNTTPYSAVLSRHQPGLTLLPQPQMHYTDVSRETSIQAMRKALESQFQALGSKADKHKYATPE